MSPARVASLLGLPSLSHVASNDMAETKGTIAALHAANIKRLQDWIALPSIAAENRHAKEGAEELAAMEKLGRVQRRPAGSAVDAAMQWMVGRLQTKIAA